MRVVQSQCRGFCVPICRCSASNGGRSTAHARRAYNEMERCVTFASVRSANQSAVSFQVSIRARGPQTTTAGSIASHQAPASPASEGCVKRY